MASEKAMVESGTKERVAFELMKHVGERDQANTGDRVYWLKLYEQCLTVTTGGSSEHALAGWKAG